MSLQKYVDARLICIDDKNVLFAKANNQNCEGKVARETLFFIDNRLQEVSESEFILDAGLRDNKFLI